MRTERNRDGSWNVWMSREEYQSLPRAADSFQHEIAIRLMGDCGLRVGEVLDVEPRHISRMTDGRHYELEAVGGKDTTGEFVDGKQRETWLPVDVEEGNTFYDVRNRLRHASVQTTERVYDHIDRV